MRALLPGLVLSFALAACGGSTGPSGSASSGAPVGAAPAASTPASGECTSAAPPPAPSGTTDLAKKPVIAAPAGPPPCTLVVGDIVRGSGPAARAGQQLTVKYVGGLYSSGKQFDASWDRGQNFPFVLGAGNVIPGWDQGLVGMHVGGRRQLVIPPALGYGAQGAGADIPPNATLIFVVDLVKLG